jgi:anti-sigma28 factor (negative regulator of flagellin synthesis)
MRSLAPHPAPSSSTDVAASPPVREEAGGTTAGPSADSPPGTVTASDTAREPSGAASDTSAVRIANLRQTIRSGTFRIDPETIANRLVQADYASRAAVRRLPR